MSQIPCTPSCTWAGTSTRSQWSSRSHPSLRWWERLHHTGLESKSQLSAFPHCTMMSQTLCTPSCKWECTMSRARGSRCSCSRRRWRWRRTHRKSCMRLYLHSKGPYSHYPQQLGHSNKRRRCRIPPKRRMCPPTPRCSLSGHTRCPQPLCLRTEYTYNCAVNHYRRTDTHQRHTLGNTLQELYGGQTYDTRQCHLPGSPGLDHMMYTLIRNLRTGRG